VFKLQPLINIESLTFSTSLIASSLISISSFNASSLIDMLSKNFQSPVLSRIISFSISETDSEKFSTSIFSSIFFLERFSSKI
jgi:hypothetical protein